MTKYRVTRYGIKPYKAKEVNDYTILYERGYEHIISTSHSWHDTFPEAKAELIRRTEQEVRLIEERLEKSKKLLKEFKKLKA